jgi:hypothetical protein
VVVYRGILHSPHRREDDQENDRADEKTPVHLDPIVALERASVDGRNVTVQAQKVTDWGPRMVLVPGVQLQEASGLTVFRAP